MTFEDFQRFIREEDSLLRSLKYSSSTDKERILARTVKISEEFGELCDEVLACVGDQRSGKMKGRNREDLEDEFADVVITIFLLAESMEVDIMKSLGQKIPKIKRKHNKQLKSKR